MKIGARDIGHDHPCYVIAEAGINHNGELAIAHRLIDAAKSAGADAIKWQKRTPDVCVPPEQRARPKRTPWGEMTYIDYRQRIEFGADEYGEINRHCRAVGLDWFASPWDEPAVDLLERFSPVAHKVASACITDVALLDRISRTGRPVIMSTGMSTERQIARAVERITGGIPAISGQTDLALLHTTSCYPCEDENVNLRCITLLRAAYPGRPVGYSGHEHGIHITEAAVVLGACVVERHFTLDRSMWGSDHAASLEPAGFLKMVRNIRGIEAALGDGVKRVLACEIEPMKRLRRVE